MKTFMYKYDDFRIFAFIEKKIKNQHLKCGLSVIIFQFFQSAFFIERHNPLTNLTFENVFVDRVLVWVHPVEAGDIEHI